MNERLRKARLLAKLSPAQLAKLLGLRVWYVREWETGESTPGYASIRAFARLTGVRHQWLEAGTGEMCEAQEVCP